MHRRAALSAVAIAVVVLSAGCGRLSQRRAPAGSRQVALLPWPSRSDYTTIKTAVAMRNQALFGDRDWRRKSFAASLAARTLLTVRVAAGPCASYVTELYGTLRDLMDAYAGENWRPLVRIARGQPALASVCLAPRYFLTNGPGA
jgi:hypothetical protein